MSGSDSQIAMQGRPIDIAGEQLKWMKPQTEFLNQGLIGAQTGEAQARIPFIGAQTQEALAKANQLIPAQAYEATGAGQYSRAHALIQPQIGYKAQEEGFEARQRGAIGIPAQANQANSEAAKLYQDTYAKYYQNVPDAQITDKISKGMGGPPIPLPPPPGGRQLPIGPAIVAPDIDPAIGGLLRAITPSEASSVNTRNTDHGRRPPTFDITKGHPGEGAAGLFQWMPDTWKEAAAGAGVDPRDMSLANQQKAAAWLAPQRYRAMTGRDLASDLRQGGHEALITTVMNKTWPSLTGGSQEVPGVGSSFMQRLRPTVMHEIQGGKAPPDGIPGEVTRAGEANGIPVVAGGLPVAGETTAGAVPTALPPGVGQPLIGSTPAAQAAPTGVPAAPVVAPSPVPTPAPAASPPTPANLIPRNSPFAPGNTGVVPTRGDAGPDTISDNAVYIPGLTPFPIPKSYLPQLVKDRSTEGMARLEAERKKDLVTTFQAQAGTDATPPMDRYNAGVNAIFGKGLIWGSQANQLLNHPEMAEDLVQGQLPVPDQAGTKARAAASVQNITQLNKFIEDDSKKNSENVDAHLVAAKNGLQMREFRDTVKGAPTGAGAEAWRLPMQQMATQFSGPWAQKLSSYLTGIKGEPTVVQMETANKMALNGVVGQEAAIPGVRPGAMLTTYLAKANPNTNMRNISIENMLNLGLVAQQMTTDFGIGSNQYFKNAFDNHQAELKAGHLTYDRLQNFEASWNSPGSDHAPAVYAASAALLNGVDPTPKGAFNGLTDSQKAEAVRIAWRADPAAIIAGHRLGQ